jgi:polysaccharide export outer membrane protein
MSRFAPIVIAVFVLAHAGAPGSEAKYRLYSGDVLEVSVFDHPDLAATVRVPDRGPIEFPLVGSIERAAGATLDEFTGEIRRRLEDGYVRQAVVSARVAEFAPRRVTVVGGVEKQGPYEIDPLSSCTLLQVIGLAGGFTPDADRARITILNNGRSALANETSAGAILVHPNDVVTVRRLDRIYVIGQVLRPGSFPLSDGEPVTITKAIALAGGFDKYAKKSQVELLRIGEKSVTVDIRKFLSGENKSADIALRPGDTVYVPESRF